MTATPAFGSPDLNDSGSVGHSDAELISTVSTMCSGNSGTWRLTCDYERVMGGGCSGMVMMGGAGCVWMPVGRRKLKKKGAADRSLEPWICHGYHSQLPAVNTIPSRTSSLCFNASFSAQSSLISFSCSTLSALTASTKSGVILR
jgi:hypothetical protein